MKPSCYALVIILKCCPYRYRIKIILCPSAQTSGVNYIIIIRYIGLQKLSYKFQPPKVVGPVIVLLTCSFSVGSCECKGEMDCACDNEVDLKSKSHFFTRNSYANWQLCNVTKLTFGILITEIGNSSIRQYCNNPFHRACDPVSIQEGQKVPQSSKRHLNCSTTYNIFYDPTSSLA